MKKILLPCVIILSLTTAMVAQKKGAVEFGLNVGLNKSSVASARRQSDVSSGYNFAGSVDYYFQIDGV